MDPERIGICGFSAGGHNCAMYSGLWNRPFVSETLQTTAKGLRPAFCILGYPFIDYLYNSKYPFDEYVKASYRWMNMDYFGKTDPSEEEMFEASAQYQVTEENPPTFIWNTSTDAGVPVLHTLKMATALAEKKVPFELHVFGEGQHGLVFADPSTAGDKTQINETVRNWIPLAIRWLEKNVPLIMKKNTKHANTLLMVKKCIPLYCMMLPALVYLIINNYIPMAGIIVAFKKYNVKTGLFGGKWIGLDNFEYLFKKDAFIIIRNTFIYNIVFIIVNLMLGVAVAIMTSDVRSKMKKRIYQSAVLFPFVVSWVVVSYIVYAFLSVENGMINNSILEKIGMEQVQWYSVKKYWPFILTFVNSWKSLGYGCLLYIAAIAGIDREMYEAVQLDGATKWQQIRFITIPNLVPTMITVVLLQIGRLFYSDFGLFYQVPQNSGAIYDVTNTIDTYVYRAMISAGGIGRSAAACVFQSIMGFILIMIANSVVRKIDAESALF